MRCADEGMLRAFLDGELRGERGEELRAHVATCARCGEQIEELRATMANMADWMASESVPAVPAAIALRRLRESLGRQTSEARRGRTRLVAVQRMRWTAGVAAAAFLALLLTITPVGLAAQEFLSTFRVQTFAAITIDPGQLPVLPKPDAALVVPSVPNAPDAREVSPAQAAQSVDFPIRQPQYLPLGLDSQGHHYVTAPVEYTTTLRLATIESYLAKAGAGDVHLPPSVDGAVVRATVPASTFTVFGLGGGDINQYQGEPAGPYLILGQSRGPALEVPDSVDVEALRNQLLALSIVPSDIQRQLRAIKDWRHTLIIPVRPGTHQDVTVSGVPGLLITHDNADATLLWQKDGVVYGLMGSYPGNELLRIANGLR